MPQAGRTYTAAFSQQVIESYQQGQTATAIAARVGVRWQAVQHILKRHEVPLRRNVIQVQIPTETSPELWRWMGYLFAEGCVEDLKKGAGKIWFTNTDDAIQTEFAALSSELCSASKRASAVRESGRFIRAIWSVFSAIWTWPFRSTQRTNTCPALLLQVYRSRDCRVLVGLYRRRWARESAPS